MSVNWLVFWACLAIGSGIAFFTIAPKTAAGRALLYVPITITSLVFAMLPGQPEVLIMAFALPPMAMAPYHIYNNSQIKRVAREQSETVAVIRSMAINAENPVPDR